MVTDIQDVPVPDGYKRTELGIIPKDWDIKSVGEICTIFGRIGFRGYTKKDIVIEGEGVITLGPGNLQDSQMDLKNCTYLSWDKWRESPEIQIWPGDTLLVKTGSTVGKTSFVSHLPMESTINPQIVVFKKRKIADALLAYLVASTDFQTQLSAAQVGGALPTLSQKQVEKFKLTISKCSKEQEAIAEALTDADEAIRSLEAVIAKKRDVKQATLHVLLTPTRRLPGFSEEWEEKEIHELCDICGGGTPSTRIPHFWAAEIAWCTPTDITALNGDKYIRSTKRMISNLGLQNSAATMIPENSIIFTSRATIGEMAINPLPISTNQGFQNLIPKKGQDTDFLFYKLALHKIDFLNASKGSTFLELGKNDLGQIKVITPTTLEEQTAISTILSDMDAQIETLETRLDKLRDVKQGMMQVLLTGKVRLI